MRSFLVTTGEPAWVDGIGTAIAEIGRAMPWVLAEQQRWRRAHPVPRNAGPWACGSHDPVWLLEPPLAPARERLSRLGFELRAPLLVPGEAPDELPHRPMVGDPGTSGPPGHEVDAWHPAERAALHVEWHPGEWPRPAPLASSLLKADAAYLVLARQARGFAETERFLTALFDDPVTVATIAAKLPLRGVWLAEV